MHQDGSEYAVATVEVWESLRNQKIADLGLTHGTTNIAEYNSTSDMLSALYVNTGQYSSTVDYMSLMETCAQDGSDYNMKMGKIYETLRNNKITQLGLPYDTTTYFTDYSTSEEILNAMFPPVIEEPVVEEPIAEESTPTNTASDYDVDILARIIYLEAGQTTSIPDDVIYMVASVVVNRVNDSTWPNTVEGVLSQSGQYSTWKNRNSCTPSERCYNIARNVLENGSTIPSNVVYQSNFTQGSGVYFTYTTSWGSKLYFCYK